MADSRDQSNVDEPEVDSGYGIGDPDAAPPRHLSATQPDHHRRLFAGFYAIVAGMNGNFIAAALAIFVAMALDTADGRVARWTRTESRFGAEYDSLSDMVAFGVAPALVAFSWSLQPLGQVGWVATFVYMACAALRLARFNTQGDLKTFTGLASPSAAAVIACTVWIWSESMGDAEPSLLVSGLMASSPPAWGCSWCPTSSTTRRRPCLRKAGCRSSFSSWWCSGSP
jgi:CDP-diacylglycerol--serine O-phosphatidyltransferase